MADVWYGCDVGAPGLNGHAENARGRPRTTGDNVAMKLKKWLVIVLLVSAAVFTAGVLIEQAAEPGSSETVLGVNPESPGLVTTGVVLSVLLAAAVLWRPATFILSVAAAFGLIFAFFDALEIFHQFQEGRSSIMAVAAIAALFHLAVTALSIVLLRRVSVNPTAM